jgi:hypothetical protein
MIEVLIDSLMEYKTQMSYKGIDFDGDKPMQYKEILLMMAKIYSEDISIFGPLFVDQLPDGFNEMSKEEKAEAKELVKISKELIAKGTKRVMEKVKEIRQAFSKAVWLQQLAVATYNNCHGRRSLLCELLELYKLSKP